MVWRNILCSRSARRESQTDLRGDRQAARDGREKEGGAEGRQPPANPPGDAFGLSASLCGRRGRRENAAGD